MATAPNAGIFYGWGAGAQGWDAQMDANLLKLDAVLQLSVKDRDLATHPGSPADGDRYIIAGSPTGAWSGHAGKIAVWRAGSSAWEIYTPATGWVAFIEDETKLSAYYSGAWSAGIAI
jgi:hypothetical protein